MCTAKGKMGRCDVYPVTSTGWVQQGLPFLMAGCSGKQREKGLLHVNKKKKEIESFQLPGQHQSSLCLVLTSIEPWGTHSAPALGNMDQGAFKRYVAAEVRDGGET